MMGNTMTAARPQRKVHARALKPCLWLVALGSVVFGVAGPAGAATTERVVVDRYSGLAISGFDPVAYFTDGRALAGKGEFEQPLAGAVWRFRNPGNRAAFMAHPNVYMPRFGGYDPVGVARGVAVPGNPQLWIVSGERLYLFYSAEDRETFANDPAGLIAAAEGAWPSIEATLAQ
jgi:hypothetical protein